MPHILSAGIFGVWRTEPLRRVPCLDKKGKKEEKEPPASAQTASLNLCNTFSAGGSVFIPGAISNPQIRRTLGSKASESVQVCSAE